MSSPCFDRAENTKDGLDVNLVAKSLFQVLANVWSEMHYISSLVEDNPPIPRVGEFARQEYLLGVARVGRASLKMHLHMVAHRARKLFRGNTNAIRG